MVDCGSLQPTAGLTAEEPAAARERFEGWGLGTAERFDEAPLETVLVCGGRKKGRVCSAGRLRALEEKHFSLPNREGAVVYIVVKALHPPRCAPAELPPPRVALVSAQQKALLRVHSTAVVSPKTSVPFLCFSKRYTSGRTPGISLCGRCGRSLR